MNGWQDSYETGVGNVLIELLDQNKTIVRSTRTDNDGHYTFDKLQVGEYRIRCVAPTGYVLTSAHQGSDKELDSDADPISMTTAAITLKSTETDLSWDCGMHIAGATRLPTSPAAIGNLVWEDFDQNGIQNIGEKGVGGITVNLYNDQHQFIASTLTNASGIYWFYPMPPGEYIVEFLIPSGFMLTLDNAGDDQLDSDITFTNVHASLIVLQEGDVNPTVDVGIVRIPTSERVFLPLVAR